MISRIVRRVRRVIQGVSDPSLWRVLRFVIRRRVHCPSRPPSAVSGVGLQELIKPDDPACSQQQSGIPETIFQTWKSKKLLPPNYAYWSQTFRDLNPTFAYVLWDDGDNRRFIEKNFPWFLANFLRFPQEIFRVDAVRMFFLFWHGGFYVDLDTECLRPLLDLVNKSDVLVGRMGLDAAFEESIPNAMMASRPFQAFWLVAIAMMIERLEHAKDEDLVRSGPVLYTGPILLKDAVDYYASTSREDIERFVEPLVGKLPLFVQSKIEYGSVTVLPSECWFPIDWTNPVHRVLRREVVRARVAPNAIESAELFPSSYAVSYWTHSW